MPPEPPEPPGSQRAPALVASCVLGAAGAVFIGAGLATGTDGLFVAGAAAGSLSLGAALYWRSQLIDAWHRGDGGDGGDGGVGR